MSRKKKKSNTVKSNKGTIFFAYQSKEKSGNSDNVDAIQNAASKLKTKAVTWEQLKVNGKLVNKKIFEEIDRVETFACDLSYLNQNVFFELGYAIGKRKKLFVMLNTNIKDAFNNYSNINILKSIGYTKFANANDIIKGINDDIDKKDDIVSQLDNCKKEEGNSIDVFYIKSSDNSQAEMDTLEYIKSSSYSQICDDSSEISYQPLEWYINIMNSCNNLIVHLSCYDKNSARIDNVKNSLLAGLGYALVKKVLLVAPKKFYAPIDYSDILIEYESASDCVEKN